MKRLKDIPFLEWENKYKRLLKKVIIGKLWKYAKIKEDALVDIRICGSRVFNLNHKLKLFKEDSDLDIIMYMKDEIFFEKFLDLSPLQAITIGKKYVDKFKLIPTIKRWYFYGILVSTFIKPERDFHIKEKFCNKWILPYYSLMKNEYIDGNDIHLIDYLQNLKRRIEKYMYCVFCNEFKDSRIQLNIDLVTENARLHGEEFTMYRFCICKDCYKKLNNNIIEIIKRGIEKCM